MTSAISAGQASVVVPAHTGAAKGGAAAKAHAKFAHDVAEKAEDSPRPTGHRDEADVHIGVKGTEKSSRRSHDDSEKSDDHSNSFEATIDGIDRTAPQNAATAAGPTADWNAMLGFGQVILDRSQKSSGGKSAGEPASNVGSVPVSAKAPKHESTTALQLARQRLLASDAAANADVAQPTDDEVTSAIIVRSRETHWSFSNTATVASSHAATVSSEDSAAANPMASFAAIGLAKNDDRTTATTTSEPMKPVLAESSPVDAARDAPDQQSFGDKREAGSEPRDRSSNGIKGHAVLEAFASKPVDKIVTDDTGAPVGMSNATQQVRNGVLNALTSGTGEAPQANASLPLQNRTMAPGQVMRTMELTLSPADLGSVTLRLSLKSNVLSVEAEATKASTAKLLSDDRDALTKSLRDAGYDVSTLKITDAGASGATAVTAAPPTSGMQFQDNGQTRMGFAQRQDGDLQRRDGSTPDQSQQRSRSNNPQASAATDAANSRQANAIYI
ncbi:MAG TPA: flagellar hook-length control protein FliK [Hyphomicrobium sp.]|uniref:flagellar hook-length control protein FliK n=1 Tax=Hyphomicrobium sp. TaxID=82 RepID=UPI002B595F91|nr:flagellar hook-length control protein FliK [Hyphomicrobium sp.]HXE00699.1 flagellar hook-length control protein FliK [Hyphomicrobium sp.]